MKNATIIMALAAILSAGAMGTATAKPLNATGEATVQLAANRGHDRDWRHGQHRILPQRAIERSLYRQGYRNIRDVRLIRGDYVMIARGYRGVVRLVVDGRTGHVISRDLLRRPQPRAGVRIQGGNGNFSYSFGIR